MNGNADETIHDMLTSKDVQEKFGITPMTLHRWRKQNKIPFVEYPKTKFRYRKADVEKILKEGF